MDYGTRVAWMLEEEDDAPLFLPDDRTSSRLSIHPTDTRLSAAFLSSPHSTSSDTTSLPSPSSSAPSSHRSPRPSSVGASGSGVLVSTGSMVSRYEKVMRASFRPPADIRTTSKQQQQQQVTRTQSVQAVVAQSSKPAAASQPSLLSSSRSAPQHSSTPLLPSSTVQRSALTHAPFTRPLISSVAEEEKQQISFTSTSIAHTPTPTTTPAAPATQPTHSQPTSQQKYETAAAPPQPLRVLVSAVKQRSEKSTVRPATPSANRWLREQERKKQEQNEREAVWTERFVQEAAERQRQRLIHQQLQQQRPQQQKQQQPIQPLASAPATELQQSQPATDVSAVPERQRAAAVESKYRTPITAATAAVRSPPSESLDENAAAATESSDSGECSVVNDGSVSDVAGQTNIRAAFRQWAIKRLSATNSQSTSSALQQTEERVEEADTAQPAFTAVLRPAAGECAEDDNVKQAADVQRVWGSDEMGQPAILSPLTAHIASAPPDTHALDDQQQRRSEPVVDVTTSSDSSSSSGSATSVSLRSCLSGAERRMSSEGRTSRRVRWVDWDVD